MKPILTIIALFIVLSAKSQQLKDTLTIHLKQQDYIAIMQKIDSLQVALINSSTLPSNQIQSFSHRLLMSLQPLFVEVRKNIKTDTAKTKKGGVK